MHLCGTVCAAPDALTFEAWLSTTDYCHRSAIFSYAIQSQVCKQARCCQWAVRPVRGGRYVLVRWGAWQ